MHCTIQRMWKQDRKWEKGPRSISTVPPGPMEHSALPMIINPDLGSVVYGSSVPTATRWFLSLLLPFHFFFFFFFAYTVPVWGSKICPTYQRGRREGSGQEAKSQPTQRMLITCVLSQAEPGHPLWIKGEIVSRSLIFHPPEMFGCSLSSGFCAREIIRAHSRQPNPSFSWCWTTSPWLLWGHWCPN